MELKQRFWRIEKIDSENDYEDSLKESVLDTFQSVDNWQIIFWIFNCSSLIELKTHNK